MNEAEVKRLKSKLKEQSKNDLVRMVLKAAAMVNFYEKICTDLKEENEKLKGESK